MTHEDAQYAFSNALNVQRRRLNALEALMDRDTFRHLEARGVGPGWRCLEVGAGAGSVAAWLAERVGPGGSLVATDLDTTVLRELSHPQLEVRQHNIIEDQLEVDEFDLIHLRLVLTWLNDRPRALQRMVAALKPGGWLVCEEMDFSSVAPSPQLAPDAVALFTRVVEAHHEVLRMRSGFDPFYGGRLRSDLVDAGLAGIASEATSLRRWSGASKGGTLWRLTLAQLRDPMTETGLVTADEVDQVMGFFEDPSFEIVPQIVVAAWGQRPVGVPADK